MLACVPSSPVITMSANISIVLFKVAILLACIASMRASLGVVLSPSAMVYTGMGLGNCTNAGLAPWLYIPSDAMMIAPIFLSWFWLAMSVNAVAISVAFSV
ncbi:hypothetical protein FQZ97_1143020 [compost metagenome]